MPEPASARLGLVAVSAGDAIQSYPANDQAKVAVFEAKALIFDAGARGSRPVSTPGTPGKVGREYLSTVDGGIDRDTGTAWVTVKPGLFSVLPTASGFGAGLDEGMEILYQTAALLAAGIGPWQLRYDSSLSGTSKWKVLSADALWAEATGVVTTASGSYVDLPGGPSITCPAPLVGDVSFGAQMTNGGAGGGALMGVKIGAAVVVDQMSALGIGPGSVPGFTTAASRTVAFGDVVKMQYASPAGTAEFQARKLYLLPRRIG